MNLFFMEEILKMIPVEENAHAYNKYGRKFFRLKPEDFCFGSDIPPQALPKSKKMPASPKEVKPAESVIP